MVTTMLPWLQLILLLLQLCLESQCACDGLPHPHMQITADPADINVLPEYSHDPRVVTNLLDGINQTRDDLHMWLAPFTPGHAHLVRVRLTSRVSLALMRVWVSADSLFR